MSRKITSQLNCALTPWWWIALSLLLTLLILPLSRQGMFMDGIIYAAIAKNLSLGYGSLWQPYYSQTDFQQFFEHPPLALFFQSLGFKLFGTESRVEQGYSLLMAGCQFTLIAWFWLKQSKAPVASLSVLLILWLLCPLNHLYINNMLEDTLTVFTTVASFLLLFKATTVTRFLVYAIPSAIVVLIAFLCNGPTAFFPLAIPLMQAIALRDDSPSNGLLKTLGYGMILALVFAGFYACVPEALNNTLNYLHHQVMASITGVRQPIYVGFKHLNVLYLYVRACWPVAVCCLLCLALNAHDFSPKRKKNALRFGLLSLLASLPVGISHRQSLNYIMPAAPFIALAAMWFCFEPVQTLSRLVYQNYPRLFKQLSSLSLGLFVGCLVAYGYAINGYNRDEAALKDIHLLTTVCKAKEVISVSQRVYLSWYTAAYLARFSMISVSPKIGHRYFLALQSETLPSHYQRMQMPLSFYQLGQRL